VQQLVEEQLARVVGERVAVHASGARTAACTRSRRWRISIRTPACLRKFAFALNAGLPPDIRVRFPEEPEASMPGLM
jgi:tRNA U38,U39,U40 pseudouridine synthase TruA